MLRFVLALLILPALPARAQDEPEPAATARLRFGPLAVTPTVRIKTLGIDTNVFNEVENPKQDFVMVAGPRADAWLRLGRARLTATGTIDYAHFNHYASERSFNSESQAGLAVPLRWFTPHVSASWVTTRERQNYEIDARVRRQETALKAGGDVRIGPRTTVGLSVQRARVDFDGAALFRGVILSQTLNRTVETAGGSLAYKLTPVTTFVLTGDVQRERFQFLPMRDAASVRMTSGLDLDAFITGRAHVGYRTLDFFDPRIPDFTGPVADVDLGFTLLGVTRFAARAERDIGYSFEIAQSYFVLNAVTASITQSLGGRRDAQARIGRQWLDYRGVGLEDGTRSERTDAVSSYGVEIGYRAGRTTRLAFHVDYTRRHSQSWLREYRGVHAGTSVTYAY